MSTDNGIELYTTQANEHVKQYIELDGSGRVYKVFTAGAKVSVNGPCEVTYYGYNGINSTVVIARKESRGVWTQTHQDAIDALI